MKLDAHERDYKRITNRTGFCLVIFVVMFNVTSIAAALLSELTFPFLPYETYYTLSSVLSAISYILSFVLPALILRAMLKSKGVLQPMNLGSELPAVSLWLIPAGIGITMTLAYVNTMLLDFLNLSETYAELVAGTQTIYQPYQIVLLYISTALVPAFCEEFLFRATVLSNLRPFGQGVALVASSVLFGLMHQNLYQVLYTTAAGLILGYAYIKTNSIWCPTLIHFFNNAFSVTEQVITANSDESVANFILPIMEVSVVVVGFVCFAIFLAIDYRKHKRKYSAGSFGVLLEADEAYEQRPISPGAKLKLFFSPGMIVFLVVALFSMLATLLMLTLIGGAAA